VLFILQLTLPRTATCLSLLFLELSKSGANSSTTLWVRCVSMSKSESMGHDFSTPYLALELLELESVKVSESSTGLAALQLLGPAGLVPGVDSIVLLEELNNGSLTSGTGKSLDDERSQGKASERVGLTGDTSGGTINQSLKWIVNESFR
jgi:hypothetical protein